MIAMDAAARIDVRNFFEMHQVMPGLQAIALTLSPRDVAATRQILHEPDLERGIGSPGPSPLKSNIVQQGSRT